MKEKKLYLVKREVRANSLEEASKGEGDIYCIELADEKFQPEKEKPFKGFKNE